MPDTPQQATLFDREPDPWDVDDGEEQLTASVVFSPTPPGRYDYLVPEELADDVEPGRRLKVPLGRGGRTAEAYCVAVDVKKGTRPLKAVHSVIDPRALLSPNMLRLTEWIAEYYLCPWGQVLETVLPAGVRAQAGTRMARVLVVAPDADALAKDAGLTPKQEAILKTLRSSAEPMTATELSRAAKCSLAPVAKLRGLGILRTQLRRVDSACDTEAAVPIQPHLALNEDQRKALAAIVEVIESRRARTLLVHGVTGSGKTEVYIQAIQHVVELGRQAIVLVPEISLTPQTVERFRSRFGRVAVLHSHLTDAERHRHWRDILDGRVTVVVGARSAIFAPAPNLGMIVLDEEHEGSFKQETAPRYHARDVAIERARLENVPLILGSATPSLESWYRAKKGEYTLVEMPRRISDRPLPDVRIVDRREEANTRFGHGIISRPLYLAVSEALREGGQVILLLNRRGFNTHIQCPACGYVASCPDCEIALTHHKADSMAICHYCDYRIPAPGACPECGFAGIRYSGTGTQRLEQEVANRFPDYACLRMDTDTMQGRGAHQNALARFKKGEVRILLGTQMIAKGLDFPNVTLVGVINADTALHLPDFRASERTFQLVTQVAGRTGRGDKGGRVWVQTFNPDHDAIVAASRHDYTGFAMKEIPLRKAFSYPPFSKMVRLIVRGLDEAETRAFTESLAGELKLAIGGRSIDARLLGPAPAPIARLRGFYRFHLQLQSTDGNAIRGLVRDITGQLKTSKDTQWTVDVDPLGML